MKHSISLSEMMKIVRLGLAMVKKITSVKEFLDIIHVVQIGIGSLRLSKITSFGL